MELPATIHIGTCAWSHEDWRTGFYPEHLPAADRLGYYAGHFSSVEVDSTFYAAPAPKVVQHWFETTPDHFLFACKAPREITHERRLRDCTEALEAFLRSLDPLGAKLACVLVQLPPSFRPRQDEGALRGFMRSLPARVRFAFEFRDPAWHTPRIVHLLEEYRVAWVWTDTTPLDHQQEGAFEFLPQTADFAYIRLLGDLTAKYRADRGLKHAYRELAWPRDVSLENWATRLREYAAELSRVFVQVNNHFEGFAPRTCQRLAALLGQPVRPFGPDEMPPEGGAEQLKLL